jgi:hypothetical protein
MKPYDYYTRSYMKLQDVTAVIGGFMKIVLVVQGFVSTMYNEHSRNEYIINELFAENCQISYILVIIEIIMF